MSSKTTKNLKQNIRDRLIQAEEDRDSAILKMRREHRERFMQAEADRDSAILKMNRAYKDRDVARAESARLRDLLRWRQGTQNRRFITV